MKMLTLEQEKETVQIIVRLLAGLDYSTAKFILDRASEEIVRKSVITLDEGDVNSSANFDEFIAKLQALIANRKEV